MNIVIVGAGNTGRYLATLLSENQHNVLVIDKDKKKLEQLSQTLDIATRVGSGDDWQLLDSVLELFPDLFIAMTQNDDTNVVSCSLAKQLGIPSTIARVHDNRYLNRTRLDFGRIFDVDHFICPELLAASELMKYIVSEGSLAVKYFLHGAVQLRTVKIPDDWSKEKESLNQLDMPEGVMIGLIYRNKSQVIFPHGKDLIMAGDEVTFIGGTEAIGDLSDFLSIPRQKIRSIVLVGGSPTAFHLAKMLERGEYSVRIFEKDYERAVFLSEHLSHTTIINHDALDIDFLRSEKVGNSDLIISCTSHDATNLLAVLSGREAGCRDVLMLLLNQATAPILQKLDINHVVSPIMLSASRILSRVFTGGVSTLVSLYDNRAEVIEVTVSMNSKVVGIPLSDLGPLLPKNFLIAIIQNRGRIIIANGQRILSPGDTVILITSPEHVAEVEKVF